MSADLYNQLKENDGWVILEKIILEEIVNYKSRLASLPNDWELVKQPALFTAKCVELSSKIKCLETVIEMPREILFKLEDKK